MRVVNMEEALQVVMAAKTATARVEAGPPPTEKDFEIWEYYLREELKRCFGEADQIVAMEEDRGFHSALMGLVFSGNDVRATNMLMYNTDPAWVMDEFVPFAEVHYAGKCLRVSACSAYQEACEVLRNWGFQVDKITHETDEEEGLIEYLECSRML